MQTSYEQDFSPVGRGQSPWCEPGRGPPVPEAGLCRQMEIITRGGMMEAVAAILIAAGVAALVILGIIVVLGAGWFILSSL